MLIVPDIHGRKFWKEPITEHFTNIKEDTDVFDRRVIFLGDYLDPYPYENISIVSSIERFKQIIAIKKEHPEDVVLLLGNHDWSYIMPDKFCTSRHDLFYEDEIRNLFMDNIDLFQMVYKCDVTEKHYIFSHAGIHPEWMNIYLGISDIDKIAELYNRNPNDIPKYCLDMLDCVSSKRGGFSAVGSPIWCDVDEFAFCKHNPEYVQIFGHTQQPEKPIITERYACLDCRQVFELDAYGQLRQIKSE